MIKFVFFSSFKVRLFPVTFGHRKCIFTGKTSFTLQELLLGVDGEMPSEEEFEELKGQALPFMMGIKAELEKDYPSGRFECIFCGSTAERFGNALSSKRSAVLFSALNTDLDVMFCNLQDSASFSGQEGNIAINMLKTDEDEKITGYTKLRSSLASDERKIFNSSNTKNNVYRAVIRTKTKHLSEISSCWKKCQRIHKIKVRMTGPAIKISIGEHYEADVTFCVHCNEWPPFSDWSTRQRCWPSPEGVTRIMSYGCHLVAKPHDEDEWQTSWRLSFSLAEVELSKLVPNTAKKCFLALKIIVKDHLQPVVPTITTYAIKTTFLNTLEKHPVGFWQEDNIQECFLTSLKELHNVLLSGQCCHYWISSINLLDEIKPNMLKLAARKIRIIQQNPAPFIYDNGCCCISPCCSLTSHTVQHHHRKNSLPLVEHDEVALHANNQEILTV